MENKIKFTFDPNNPTNAVFQLGDQTKTLSAEKISKMISDLAKTREAMQPPIEMAWPLNEAVQTVNDPRWIGQLDQMTGGTILGLKHPGLGSLFFLFPAHERQNLQQLLQAQQEEFLRSSQQGPGTVN